MVQKEEVIELSLARFDMKRETIKYD